VSAFGQYFLANAVLGLWCLTVLAGYKAVSGARIDLSLGTRRVMYFSAMPQIGMAIGIGVIFMSMNTMNPAHVTWNAGIAAVSLLGASAVLRLAFVYRTLMLETHGHAVPALIALAGCIDSWVVLRLVWGVALP
jgi:hypothetical protein